MKSSPKTSWSSFPALLHRTLTAVAVSAVLTGSLALGQIKPTHREDIVEIDRRVVLPVSASELSLQNAARAHLGAMLPSAVADIDPLLGVPAFVRASDGFLTGAGGSGRGVNSTIAQALPSADPYLAIKAFLNEHSGLFGQGAEMLNSARLSRDYVNPENGIQSVVWEQQLDGIPVFQSVLMGHITVAGELVSISSLFLPNAAQKADAGTPDRAALQSTPPVSVTQAISLAARNVGISLAEGDLPAPTGPSGDGSYLSFAAASPTLARLVWLPLNRNELRLSWEVHYSGRANERFRFVIDAITGEVLVRQNLTKYISDATYNVFTSDSPSPFTPGLPIPGTAQPQLVNRNLITTPALDTTASPDGWIPDASNTTTGNNADAFVDRNFDGAPDQARPVGNPNRVFDFPLDLTLDPTNYIDASTVQMFYWMNWYHDRLYQLGFT